MTQHPAVARLYDEHTQAVHNSAAPAHVSEAMELAGAILFDGRALASDYERLELEVERLRRIAEPTDAEVEEDLREAGIDPVKVTRDVDALIFTAEALAKHKEALAELDEARVRNGNLRQTMDDRGVALELAEADLARVTAERDALARRLKPISDAALVLDADIESVERWAAAHYPDPVAQNAAATCMEVRSVRLKLDAARAAVTILRDAIGVMVPTIIRGFLALLEGSADVDRTAAKAVLERIEAAMAATKLK